MPYPTIRSNPLMARLVCLILFATLAGGLVLPKVAGAGLALLAATGLVWLALNARGASAPLLAHEKLLLLAPALFVLAWLGGWLASGLHPAGWSDAGAMVRLLLIIPVYLLLRRIKGIDRAWWAGLTVGCLAAGGYALWFALSGEPGEWYYRVGGATNPIYFGGIVLALGLMLLPRLKADDATAKQRALTLAAIVLALAASALSGSRGGWLALPVVLAIHIITMGSRHDRRWRFGLPLALAVAALLISFNPLVTMGDRLTEGAAALGILAGGDVPSETLGTRWELWGIAADLIRENPWSGVGPGVYSEAVDAAVAAGRIPPEMGAYTHPHNQYLSALLMAGVPGLAAFLLLLAVPITRSFRLLRTGLQGTRQLGWCGIAAFTILAIMGLSESFFERNTGIVWYVIFAAVIPAVASSRRHQELTQPGHPRIHSISVIIICKNEADRIEAGLRSVHGWADEIVVLDSGSTDDTVAICQNYTDQVEITDWPGFGPQKQRALDRASGDWVLSLDADETVSDELRREIDRVLAEPVPRFDGYELPWLTRAFGGQLRFGRWSRAPLRLFRRSRGAFTQALVHEKVVLHGSDGNDRERKGKAAIGRLEGPLFHDVFRDLAHARAKLSSYARLQARERHRQGRRAGLLGPWLRASLNFLDNYLVRAAFLDGRAGWTMSWLYAWYTFEKYQALRRLTRRTP